MRLQARDNALLGYLARAKWLTTEQIGRVFFPGKSLDAVRKRMRKLKKGRLLASYRTSRMDELLHGSGRPPKQVEHLVGINWLRIHAESDGCEFFYAYWELGEFRWEYPVIPDAVLRREGALYLIEYDCGTESTQQLKEKFRTYACFEFPFSLVLVADTSRRLERLRRVASLAIGPVEIRAAVLDEIRSDQAA